MTSIQDTPPQLVLILVHWKQGEPNVVAKEQGEHAQRDSDGGWFLRAPSYPRLGSSGQSCQIAIRLPQIVRSAPLIDGVPMRQVNDGSDILWIVRPGSALSGTPIRRCELQGRHGTTHIMCEEQSIKIEIRDDTFTRGFQYLVRSSLFSILTEEIWGKVGPVHANTAHSIPWARVLSAVDRFCCSVERVLDAPRFAATQRNGRGTGRPQFPSALMHLLSGHPPASLPSTISVPDYDIDANQEVLSNVATVLSSMKSFHRVLQARAVASLHPNEEFQFSQWDLEEANHPESRKARGVRAREEQTAYLDLWQARTKSIQSWCDTSNKSARDNAYFLNIETALHLWRANSDYWTTAPIAEFPNITLIKQPPGLPTEDFLEGATYRIQAYGRVEQGAQRPYLRILFMTSIEFVTARFLDLDRASIAAEAHVAVDQTEPKSTFALESIRLEGFAQQVSDHLSTLADFHAKLISLGVRAIPKVFHVAQNHGPHYSTCRSDFQGVYRAIQSLSPKLVDRPTVSMAHSVCEGPKYYEYWAAAYLCSVLDEMSSMLAITEATKGWRLKLTSACISGSPTVFNWRWNGLNLIQGGNPVDSTNDIALWIQPVLFPDGTLALDSFGKKHRRPDMVLTIQSSDGRVHETVVFDAKYQVFDRHDGQMEAVAYEMTATPEQHQSAAQLLVNTPVAGITAGRCRGYGMEGRFRVFLLHPNLRAAPLTSGAQPWSTHSFYGQSPAWKWPEAIGLGLTGSGRVGSVSLRPERTGDLRRLLFDLILRCAGEYCDVHLLREWRQNRNLPKPYLPFELSCPMCSKGTIKSDDQQDRRSWIEYSGTCSNCRITVAYTYCQSCLHHWLIKHKPGETVHSTLGLSGGFENARCPACGSYYLPQDPPQRTRDVRTVPFADDDIPD
jgi:hypothetical protein